MKDLKLDEVLAKQEPLRKLIASLPEETLSAEWRASLDRRLLGIVETTSHRAGDPVADLVKSLPVDEPSLAWRSDLNEQIRAISKRSRPRWQGILFKSALGTAMAGALAVTIIMPNSAPKPGPVATESKQNWMVAAHERQLAYHEMNLSRPMETAGFALHNDEADIDLGAL